MKEKSKMPGPIYNPDDLHSSPGWKMGSSKRDTLGKDNYIPGPGNYEPASTISEGPAYGFGGRHPMKDYRDAPGPGAYKPTLSYTKESAPGCKMGSGARNTYDTKQASKIPGPGSYSSPARPSTTGGAV